MQYAQADLDTPNLVSSRPLVRVVGRDDSRLRAREDQGGSCESSPTRQRLVAASACATSNQRRRRATRGDPPGTHVKAVVSGASFVPHASDHRSGATPTSGGPLARRFDGRTAVEARRDVPAVSRLVDRARPEQAHRRAWSRRSPSSSHVLVCSCLLRSRRQYQGLGAVRAHALIGQPRERRDGLGSSMASVPMASSFGRPGVAALVHGRCAAVDHVLLPNRL